MSTAQSVKVQLQSDIERANNATGNSDTTIHDCVNALISGYGQTGGSGGGNNNFVLLHTEIINARYVIHIPFLDDWNNYDIIYVVPDVTFSAQKEWFYYGYNEFSDYNATYHYLRLDDGGYPGAHKDHAFQILVRDNGKWNLAQMISETMPISADIYNLCFSVYESKNKMTGSIKLYGIKL